MRQINGSKVIKENNTQGVIRSANMLQTKRIHMLSKYRVDVACLSKMRFPHFGFRVKVGSEVHIGSCSIAV